MKSSTMLRVAGIIFFLVATMNFYTDSGTPATFLALGATFIALSGAVAKKDDDQA